MEPTAPTLSLNSIPVDVQETIAFFVATSSPSGPPSGLASLLQTSKHLSQALSRQSLPHLYARIFRASFDFRAITRRFPQDRLTAGHLGDELVRRWESLSRLKHGIYEGQLEADLWLVWMMLLENDGKNLQHLLVYANARSFIKLYSKMYLLPQQLSSIPPNPKTFKPLPNPFRESLSSPRLLPIDSTKNALALSIFWYINDSARMSVNESNEEKIELQTMLRLFVFAAQKFDAFLAPWNHLYLPAPPSSSPPPPSPPRHPFEPPDPFLADLSLRSRRTTIQHLGSQPLTISPPVSAQAALLSFYTRVASSISERAGGVTEGGAPLNQHPGTLFGTGAGSATGGGLEPGEGEGEAGWSKVKRSSKDFDLDWERLTRCLDPVRSPEVNGGEGLGVWRCRGTFEGVWGGNFAFLDFDSYRDMLGGRTRAIYEGPFGLQPQIWRLTETLVLRPAHLSPFPFPPSSTQPSQTFSSSSPPLETFLPSALNAGFPPSWTTPPIPHSSSPDAEVLTGVPGYTLVSPQSESSLRERRKVLENGRLLLRPEEREKEEKELRELEERLEIIVTGQGHSAWGRFYVSGRVRCWDGMMCLMKEYYPDSRGKWLYRGYTVAGGAMVGRWRDSFSELNYHGYEGSFQMTKRE